MSLIKNSFCVVTIAGTAAVEGRLCDKPVIFFSDKFYSEKLEYVYTEYNFNNLPKLIKSFSNPKSDYACKDANSFNSYISSISRDCYIYDPIIYPHVLCEDNIIKLAESINEMVYYGEK
ncbi:hypothetical protein [Photobacterium leiognathi]|uniref:hypothetical protein n=1 Tax=Photobacterium leiognathi TaxID=553611 RepID=UPI002736C9FF|nr:hypothetical protein [Photobacterium leiognathi]